ncbi:MAG TPA: hypothetical protein VMK66_13765 [Myxococcales bacterium]|nr:hypothetical protein [Myxococcales bacterium]
MSGPVDTHCTLPDGGTIAQEVNQASCAGSGGDAGVADYGDTLYNSEGDDDDCKYHVRFSNSDIEQNKDVNFTVVATVKAPPGGAATGANIIAEVFLNDTHPAPNSGQHVTESPPGTYNVGPIRFDAAGRWTVRFHLHEDCADEAEDSPHGHVAFYLDVP